MKKLNEKIPMIVKGFLVGFLFIFSYLFQYIPVYLFDMDVSSLDGNARMAVLFSAFSETAILFILLLIYRKDLIEDFSAFKNHFQNYFNVGLKSWFSGLVIMMVANYSLSTFFHSAGANNETIVRSMISAFPMIMAVDIILVAPLVEELVFRKTLKDIIPNKWVYIFFSFLLFGLAHVATSASSFVDWLYIIPYGTLGGFFAYADYETNTIFTSVTFHMIHNAMVFLLVFLML